MNCHDKFHNNLNRLLHLTVRTIFLCIYSHYIYIYTYHAHAICILQFSLSSTIGRVANKKVGSEFLGCLWLLEKRAWEQALRVSWHKNVMTGLTFFWCEIGETFFKMVLMRPHDCRPGGWFYDEGQDFYFSIFFYG